MTKIELRTKSKSVRKSIVGKVCKDEAIINNLISLSEYNDAALLLCYASLSDEISTDILIDKAKSDGKKVALPYCEDESGKMSFYYIKDGTDLIKGSFGIDEPDVNKCERVVDFTDSVAVVPGLCFDKKGNRLGYGKGYYDRFLKNYSFISIGLCYNSLVINEIPAEEYDRRVDIIVTESEIIRVGN